MHAFQPFQAITASSLQAKTKEAQSLEAQAKEKDALLAQKQRQIDGLVEGMERRPGVSSGATGENVAMARLKEKFAAEVSTLKAAQEQVNTRLKEVRLHPRGADYPSPVNLHRCWHY